MDDLIFVPGCFKDKNIIVTGGGSGIGFSTAKQLAQLGASVFLFGRNQEKLDQAVKNIQDCGGKVFSFSLDIRQEDFVKQAVSNVIKECGIIHGLVNNAGGQFVAPLAAISKNGFDAVINTNLTGLFLVSREVYNQSMVKTGGSIVNMLMNMWGGFPMMGHSGAAREGAWNLTKTAAVEWGQNKVRVNAVAPGLITSGLENYKEEFIEYLKTKQKKIPLNRFGNPDEVRNAIIFLLSDLASYITGTCINIDGGSSLNTFLWPPPLPKPTA